MDNAIDKIAKLLALAESPNENEAKAALLKARELMVEHKLRPEQIAPQKAGNIIKREVGITCTKMTNTWAVRLSAIIAKHYCCGAYRNHRHREKKITIGFVGLDEDFQVCEKIFKYAFDCVVARCEEIKVEFRRDWAASDIRKMCNAYGEGFCSGLSAAFLEQCQAHQEWGLVMVTPQAVKDKMADMGAPSRYGTIKVDAHGTYFANKGYEDGKKFDPSHRLEESDGELALASEITPHKEEDAMEPKGARTYFTPVINETYVNRNGSEYICKEVYSPGDVRMERIKDGWSLIAHGVQQYEDGTIEWNYSTGGCWIGRE